MHNNSIRVLKPYKWNGIWVFDDAAVGLEREAFVAGIDTILDLATADIENAQYGFILQFSDAPFPGADLHLAKSSHADECAGTYYKCEEYGIEGWLCPALFLYFEEAPEHLYARFLPLSCKSQELTKQKQQRTEYVG